jgi:hypothetical protein
VLQESKYVSDCSRKQGHEAGETVSSEFCSSDFFPLKPAMVRATKKQVSKVNEDEYTKKKQSVHGMSAMVRAPRKSQVRLFV